MAGQHLKQGEKVLFGIAIVFVVAAVLGYVLLESYRVRSDKPIFASKTHYDLSPEGLKGSEVFRKRRCTSCHRALRNGTNMGLSLDGVGSKRSREWLYNFLHDPEATYGAPTIDHGYPPKEASYVASLPDEELQYLATFISELKADQGSAAAPEPPSGRSEFIDSMVGAFAPKSWKEKYKDVRERDGEQQQQGDQNEQ
ncbi:MAG TPA: cytochrome c [Gammaproteobacteria bacterium]|nr:cytochrome c [Gammaproteobacteria bacterium]